MSARTRRPRESGQAMPLAAVGLFAMALGVMATLNLGQAVHEKIRLQNTADSAAYTLAAMEARTFNYIAFLNRTQLAHYNTAMVVQSYITWVGFQTAVAGQVVDIIDALAQAAQAGVQNAVPCPPYGSPINNLCTYGALLARVQAVAAGMKARRKIMLKLRDRTHAIGHELVEALAIFNRDVVWQAQSARALLLNAHILSGMQAHIQQLDPDLKFKGRAKGALLNMAVNAGLNAIEYNKVWDNASGMNPFIYNAIKDMKRTRQGGGYHPQSLDSAGKDAYRLMTELCHATRTPRFVYSRLGGVMTPTFPEATMYMPMFMGLKRGQTKFTARGTMFRAEVFGIRSDRNYAVGKWLSSDDYLKSGGGGAFSMDPTAIATVTFTGGSGIGDAVAAYLKQGKHYRYTGGTGTGTHAPKMGDLSTYPSAMGFSSSNFQQSKQNRHKKLRWPGFAPYFKFKPNKKRTADYNQPSTWILLNKHHETFQTGEGSHAQETRAPWYSNFSWENGEHVAQLNTAIGGPDNSYLFEGLNVISRGMAYYHRPTDAVSGKSNWKEHPNFFNPYWRARLAPVGRKLQQIWDENVTQNLTIKSDSKVLQGMMSVLRGAQMDLYTEMITALVTH